VTSSVIGAISPQLEHAEIERAQRKPTESLQAYDYYLRAFASLQIASSCSARHGPDQAAQSSTCFHRGNQRQADRDCILIRRESAADQFFWEGSADLVAALHVPVVSLLGNSAMLGEVGKGGFGGLGIRNGYQRFVSKIMPAVVEDVKPSIGVVGPQATGPRSSPQRKCRI
jgi:hypothetical protein